VQVSTAELAVLLDQFVANRRGADPRAFPLSPRRVSEPFRPETSPIAVPAMAKPPRLRL